ncbi:MAG: hypothetical protein KF819_28410 [Labilithrix sp.]|nr:hypothetical protein [Labilithrix sp.]
MVADVTAAALLVYDSVVRGWLSALMACALVVACAPSCSPFGEAAAADAGTDGAADGQADGGIPDGAQADSGVVNLCGDVCATGTECVFFDFTGTTCPPAFNRGGDQGTARCDGALVIDADGTLDANVELTVRAPQGPFSIHAATTATISEWVGSGGRARRLVDIAYDGTVLAVLRASSASGPLAYELCGPNVDCTPVKAPSLGVPHRLTFDVNPTGVTLSIDCVVTATRMAPIPLAPRRDVRLIFGDTDGEPMRGRFDDLIVSFPSPIGP